MNPNNKQPMGSGAPLSLSPWEHHVNTVEQGVTEGTALKMDKLPTYVVLP